MPSRIICATAQASFPEESRTATRLSCQPGGGAGFFLGIFDTPIPVLNMFGHSAGFQTCEVVSKIACRTVALVRVAFESSWLQCLGPP